MSWDIYEEEEKNNFEDAVVDDISIMPTTSQAAQGRGLTNISEAGPPRGVCSTIHCSEEMGTPENRTMTWTT